MLRALLLLAALCSSGCSRALTDGTVAPTRRAAIERALTSQPLRRVIHGSTASMHSITRYEASGRVQIFSGTQHHAAREPLDMAGLSPRTGTFVVRPNGALEERWGPWMTRKTGRVAGSPFGSPAFVSGALYEVAARSGTYHSEEMAKHGVEDGFHVILELSFTDPVRTPKPFEAIACEVLVHLRVRLLKGHEVAEAEAVDVYLPCRVELNAHGPRISFDDEGGLDEALDPWVRPRATAKLRQLVHEATPHALTFDPADLSVLWRAP